MKLDQVFGGLNISSAGLGAQRRRMNAIAENLANADTTKTEKGGPYRRKIVQLKAKGVQLFAGMNITPIAILKGSGAVIIMAVH